MDYSKQTVPFLGDDDIEKRVDSFRVKYDIKTVPVDIDHIVEIKLGIEIIPTPELKARFDTDALITADWKSIYVDTRQYMDDRYIGRLRFSIAHEIGHFILHKKIYENLGIEKIEDFYKFLDQFPEDQYGYLETQANKFASKLLIPSDHLNRERKKILAGKPELEQVDARIVNSYIAIPLSNIFEVSEAAVEIALNNLCGC